MLYKQIKGELQLLLLFDSTETNINCQSPFLLNRLSDFFYLWLIQ